MDPDDLFERDDRHGARFLEAGNEGDEFSGQIAACLLIVANLPVAVSILIKGAIRFISPGEKSKGALANFNRFQKKHLMRFHYYLNPAIVGVGVWHYMSSRCLSTPLPEWGLFLMVGATVSGIINKYRLCPKVLRAGVHRIHTQPMIFAAMILVLTAGHLIAD
jgi:hypothetical protein